MLLDSDLKSFLVHKTCTWSGKGPKLCSLTLICHEVFFLGFRSLTERIQSRVYHLMRSCANSISEYCQTVCYHSLKLHLNLFEDHVRVILKIKMNY